MLTNQDAFSENIILVLNTSMYRHTMKTYARKCTELSEQLAFPEQEIDPVLLTVILPEPKVISLCHEYRARLACTSVQSDQTVYCWLTNFKFSS